MALRRGLCPWEGGTATATPFPCSAMEKGKLHKAGKDTSKRGRQVSGTWGLDKLWGPGQPRGGGTGPPGRLTDG